MNSKKKQRRVVNFNKDDFDKIRKYCDTHALDMSKWIIKITFDKINKGEI
jgi:hypothetical protein